MLMNRLENMNNYDYIKPSTSSKYTRPSTK